MFLKLPLPNNTLNTTSDYVFCVHHESTHLTCSSSSIIALVPSQNNSRPCSSCAFATSVPFAHAHTCPRIDLRRCAFEILPSTCRLGQLQLNHRYHVKLRIRNVGDCDIRFRVTCNPDQGTDVEEKGSMLPHFPRL